MPQALKATNWGSFPRNKLRSNDVFDYPLKSAQTTKQTMQQPLSARRESWLLYALAGIQFTHIMDFMIMMPLGPQFTKIFQITDAQFGFLVSAYTLAAGASGLLASLYIDRFGRKRLLVVFYALFAVATLACGLAQSYGSLMAARIAAGVFGGVLSALVQTIVADVVPYERRGAAMGIVMSAFSVATVAGVPSGLFLAAHFDWHMPFFVIAGVSALLAVFAGLSMPVLTEHLGRSDRRSALGGILQALHDVNHLKAFAFTALLMFGGFTVIPYITLYMTTNGGFTPQQIPYIYLCGGATTLVTTRFFGRLTDQRGKVWTYRLMAAITALAVPLVTLSAGLPLWGVLLVTTLFFICMSGRMIPGMAVLTSAANPDMRGTFMALNSSVQSASMGLAAFVGGLIISRDAQGLLVHYWLSALVGVAASVCAIWLVGKLHLHGQQQK
jgi:predicted MFS family arabinose efflux permease